MHEPVESELRYMKMKKDQEQYADLEDKKLLFRLKVKLEKQRVKQQAEVDQFLAEKMGKANSKQAPSRNIYSRTSGTSRLDSIPFKTNSEVSTIFNQTNQSTKDSK